VLGVSRVFRSSHLLGLGQARFDLRISALPRISALGLRILTFLVLASLLCSATGCHREQKAEDASPVKVADNVVSLPTNSPQLATLTLEPVEPETAAVMPLAGRLIWDENTTVRVFTPYAGRVRKVLAEVGQSVTNGMPLAEIQSPDFDQAQAEARKAGSEFRRAERTLNRVRDLFEHGAAPRKDVESAEADYASAQAEKDRAESRLAIYGATASTNNLGFLLPSPLEGVLVERNVTPGQEVRPDQMLANLPQFTAPLFVVTDPSRLWIQIDATEADMPFLRPGCPFTFTSRAFPDQTFTGHVATVSEFIDPTTKTIKVRGKVDNAHRLLKAEMFVSVHIPGEQKPGASVPSKAVFLKGDKHYLFLEEQPGQFARQEVQIGSEQADRTLVVAGVHPGQRVVTDGCLLLQQTLK
jgi:membrane fusion protein, heavy metal efflux system